DRQGLVPAGVHAIVIGEVGSILDLADPRLIGAVPLDGCSEAGSEIHFGRPAPFATDLRAIDRITAVMTRPILHKLDERFRLVRQTQDLSHDFEVRFLVTATDVVDLAWRTAVKSQKDRTRVFIVRDPLPYVN